MSTQTAPATLAECEDCANPITDPDVLTLALADHRRIICEWCQEPDTCGDCGSTSLWSRMSHMGTACWTTCADCGERWLAG